MSAKWISPTVKKSRGEKNFVLPIAYDMLRSRVISERLNPRVAEGFV